MHSSKNFLNVQKPINIKLWFDEAQLAKDIVEQGNALHMVIWARLPINFYVAPFYGLMPLYATTRTSCNYLLKLIHP